MQSVIDRYGYVQVVRETITDHGSQFTAHQLDKNRESNSIFDKFLPDHGIKHILCWVNHPQSNGKIEKWFGFYEKFRSSFESFDQLIEWYNNRPHGCLNLRRAETQSMAFGRKLPTVYWFGLGYRSFGW